MTKGNRHSLDLQRDEDMRLIDKLAVRAHHIYAEADVRADLLEIKLDLMCCHQRACKLDLMRLSNASDFNLMHDIVGINRHLNRDTYKLENCFLPRFAMRQMA